MALFRRNKTIQLNADAVAKYSDKVAQIPDDLMARCPKCHKVYFTKQKPEDYCCMHCHHHLPFPAIERIDWLVDEGSFQEINADLWNDNPLGFPKDRKSTRLNSSHLVISYAVFCLKKKTH